MKFYIGYSERNDCKRIELINRSDKIFTRILALSSNVLLFKKKTKSCEKQKNNINFNHRTTSAIDPFSCDAVF